MSKVIKDSFDLIRTWSDTDGCGFRLHVYDTYQSRYGKSVLAYQFFQGETLVFECDEFGASPSHAIDSDKTLAGILSFIALKPGDTDREYFADYTPAQLEWASEWAERLWMCKDDLENGRQDAYCECGEPFDTDCNGNQRCAVCDEPCLCCSDGPGPNG